MVDLVISVIVLIIVYAFNYFGDKKSKKEREEHIKKIKKETDVLKIDLTTIKIKHHKWEREVIVDVYGKETRSENTTARGHYKFKKKKKHKSNLSIPVTYNGKTHLFLTTLLLDGHWLGIKFHIQKHSNIYIDKNDIENSYIDFTFLNKKNIDLCVIHTNDSSEY